MSLSNSVKEMFLPITRNFHSKELDKALFDADLNITVPEYCSIIIFSAIIAFIIYSAIGFIILILLNLTSAIGIALIASLFATLVTGVVALLLPYYFIIRKISSIKDNLALAVLSMSTIGESGVAPQHMFNAIAKEKEYRIVSNELSKIKRYMDELGLSLSEALQITIDKTVSNDLKKFLVELKATLESGGDLTLFLTKQSEQAQFNYQLRVEDATKRAELFGDIYTAVVIAAPLFIFASVMLMGMFGTDFLHMDLEVLMTIGIFAFIPIINGMFMLTMELMSPLT